MNILMVVFLVFGFMFMLLATVGALRFPDFFMRMAAVSKASTLGIVLMLFAGGLAFHDMGTWIKVFCTASIFFMGAPISAHLLGRSAYRKGVRFYKGTRRDDYKKTLD